MSSDAIPPLIAAHINHLLNHFPLSVKVENMWSGSKHYPGFIDRFTLVIPYCLEFIKWDIIYNAESPLSAPDIVFGPHDDNFRPFISKVGEEGGDHRSSSNSLRDWNSRDPSRLMSLIQELRDRYMTYQRKRVEGVDDERLKFELSTMLSREGIEMHLSSGAEKPEEVKFSVPLVDMNINKMVPGCSWKHLQKIYLQVLYPVVRKYASVPAAPRLKLVSTPELKALLSVDDIKLPSWIDGMCMAEYLPHLEETLEKQVQDAVSLIDVRRSFIEALEPFFGMPLEADSVFCRMATVITASGVFTFLVHFYISTQFPKQQPSLILQSSQHFNSQGAPIKSQLITNYPWSPRWEAPLMVERIFEFLADEALNFKRYCADAQLQ